MIVNASIRLVNGLFILFMNLSDLSAQISKTNLLKSVWKWYETCMFRLKFNKNVLSDLEYFI